MGKRTALLRGVAVFSAVILLASPAHANIVIPVFFTGWVAMVLVLIPVIIVESIIVSFVGGSGWRLPVLAIPVANLVSFLVGLPLALLHDGVAHRIFGLNEEDQPAIADSLLGFPVGLVSFVILLFGLSWWIEESVVIRFLDQFNPQQVSDAVFYANLATYSAFLLLALAISVSHVADIRNRPPKPDYYAPARARRAEQIWRAQHRDELLKSQDRPMREADLLEAWRRGNRYAKQGLALLASAEAGIDHQVSADSDNASIVKRKKKPSRAA